LERIREKFEEDKKLVHHTLLGLLDELIRLESELIDRSSLKAEDKEFMKKLKVLPSFEELRKTSLYEFKMAWGITMSRMVQQYLRKRGEKCEGQG
jgi:hypothetical protein